MNHEVLTSSLKTIKSIASNKLLITIAILFPSLFVNAQTWFPLGTGANNWVNALTIYNDSLIVGGRFNYVGSTSALSIAQWNGSMWSSMGSGIKGLGPSGVFSLAPYNGGLYVGGHFDTAGSIFANSLAEWIGVSWYPVGSGVNAGGYGVTALCVFDSVIYAGGFFDSSGHTATPGIAQWNGTNWIPVGAGTNWAINAMCVYNNNLYVGGSFDSSGLNPIRGIAEWNGSSFIPVGTGLSKLTKNYYRINAMVSYNGKLYVGGVFDSIGGIAANNIAAWDGSTWSGLGSGVAYCHNTGGVNALTVYNGNLVAAGGFDSAGGTKENEIASWNGSSWSGFGKGIGLSDSGWVNALCVYQGDLYAGGAFDSAGGVAASNIARWSTTAGINEVNSKNFTTSLFPNPNNGRFTIELQGVRDKEQVEIYNMLGERVYSSPLTINHSQFTIDISGHPAGVYMYRLVNETGAPVAYGKFVIE
jgi:hypothetical protein